jgi:hypothetical protein
VLAEERENMLIDLVDDTLNVLKATKIAPSRICYYSAAAWKWRMYRSLLARAIEGEVNVGEVMRGFAQDPSLKANIKAIASFVPKVLKTLSKLPVERKRRLATVDLTGEKIFIKSALDFLEERFSAKVAVYSEEDEALYDPKNRATLAIPGQPAIYIE